MSEIIRLDDHRPVTDLAHFTLCLDAKGRPILCLTWADTDFIEKHDTISERFRALRVLVDNSTDFLEECAQDFEETTNDTE